MTSFVAHSDPEMAAELRDQAEVGQRPRRTFPTPAAKARFERGALIPPSVRLGIWEALEQGYWICKGCGAHAVQVDAPEVCEPCQEKRAAWRWVWHEPQIKGGVR